MTGFTRVIAAGNLTRTPELKELPSGDKVAEFRLAASERYTTKSGEKAQRTCFIDIVSWGRQAELCEQYLTKGAPALVEGRLQQDRWETQDGQPRSRMKVRADRIHFLPGKQAVAEDGAAAAPIDDRLPTEDDVGF